MGDKDSIRMNPISTREVVCVSPEEYAHLKAQADHVEHLMTRVEELKQVIADGLERHRFCLLPEGEKAVELEELRQKVEELERAKTELAEAKREVERIRQPPVDVETLMQETVELSLDLGNSVEGTRRVLARLLLQRRDAERRMIAAEARVEELEERLEYARRHFPPAPQIGRVVLEGQPSRILQILSSYTHDGALVVNVADPTSGEE